MAKTVELVIHPKFDIKETEAEARELRSTLVKILEDTGNSDAKFAAKVKKIINSVDKALEKVDDLNSHPIELGLPTKEFEELLQQIDEARNRVDELKSSSDAAAAAEYRQEAEKYDTMIAEKQTRIKQLQEASKSAESHFMKASGEETANIWAQQMSEANQQLETTKQELQQANQLKEEFLQSPQGTFLTEFDAKVEEAELDLADLHGQVELLRQQGGLEQVGLDPTKENAVNTALDTEVDKMKQVIIQHRKMGEEANKSQSKTKASIDRVTASVKNLGNTIKKSGSSSLANMSKSIQNIERGAGRVLKSLKKGAVAIAGLILGARGLFSIFRKFRTAVIEGFKALEEGDKGFKDQIDGIKNQFEELKVSLALAFKPIVEMAIPYIQQLIQWLQKLLGYIASFTALISGQNSYAKAIKKTGDAAKSASKQLSKFDELNNLSSDSGSGGSGFDFERVPIDQKVVDWLEKIKTLTGAIKDQFMEWVGTPFLEGLQPEKTKKLFLDLVDDCKLLGENVKKIFSDPEIQEAQKKFVQTTSKTLGSLTGLGTDVALIIGDAVVDGFNKYVTENEGKVKGNMLTRLFDFTSLIEQIGTIADAFREIFSVVHDNEDAINIVSNGFSAWDDLLTGLIDSFAKITVGFTNMFALPITENVSGWQTAIEDLLKVGSDISDFFAEAVEDIKGWLSQIGDIFGNFFTKVGGVLAKVTAKILEIWDKVYPVLQTVIAEIQSIWNEYIAPIVDDIIWIVGELVSALGKAIEKIWEYISPVVQWIIDYVVPVLVPILKGIITVIGSIIKIALIPLKATLTAIKSLIQLMKGDVEGAGETWKKFGEGVKNTFAGIGEKFKGIWEELKAGLDTLFGQFQEWGEKIYGPNGIWQTFFNTIGAKWKEFWSGVLDYWSWIGEQIKNVATSIKDWFGARIDDITGFFTNLKNKAQKFFTETIPGFFNNIKQKFADMKTNLQNGVNNIVTFFTNFKTKLSGIVDNIKTFFTNLGTFFSTLFTQTIPNIFKRGVNLAIGFINKLIGGVESAVNAIVGALNSLHWDVPSWIPGIGGQSFGFSIPTVSYNRIPALASGAVIPPSMGDFIARLGDNNRETEVVSPLSTIQEALVKALQQTGIGGDIHVHVDLDGREIAKSVVRQDSITRMSRGVGLFGT